MEQCLKNSLTAASMGHLKPYQAQYMFKGVKYGALMYKTIMRLATIDPVATTVQYQHKNTRPAAYGRRPERNSSRELERGPTGDAGKNSGDMPGGEATSDPAIQG